MCRHLLRLLLQLATGGHAFEEGLKGTESAAKFYDAPSTLQQRGGAATHSERFPDATKGIQGTGPFISKQHTAHVIVCSLWLWLSSPMHVWCNNSLVANWIFSLHHLALISTITW
jgi:hypothetical protein